MHFKSWPRNGSKIFKNACPTKPPPKKKKQDKKQQINKRTWGPLFAFLTFFSCYEPLETLKRINQPTKWRNPPQPTKPRHCKAQPLEFRKASSTTWRSLCSSSGASSKASPFSCTTVSMKSRSEALPWGKAGRVVARKKNINYFEQKSNNPLLFLLHEYTSIRKTNP